MGNTDRIADDAYSQKLSERRANTVKKHLVSKGIEESRCFQSSRRVIVEIETTR